MTLSAASVLPVDVSPRAAWARLALDRVTTSAARAFTGSTVAIVGDDGAVLAGTLLLPLPVGVGRGEGAWQSNGPGALTPTHPDPSPCGCLPEGERTGAGTFHDRTVWAYPIAPGARLVLHFDRARTPTDVERELLRTFAETAAVVLETTQTPSPSLDPLGLHDSLTHLPDGRLLDLRLTEEIASAARGGRQLAVLTIDLDGLRHVNDRLGRDAGDRVLKSAGSRLHHAVRRTDALARVGEDEFSVVAQVSTENGTGLADRHEGAHLAQRLLETLGRPLTIDGETLTLSASVGLAVYPVDGTDAATLRRNSVTALHRAKLRGKNQFECFTPRMSAAAMDRLALEADLREALAGGQFELHYQPIVDPARHVSSLEALIRWRHPVRGPVSPAEFIPVAEQTGLIVPIGAWVLRESARQAAEWLRGGRAVRVACNVSPVQFLRDDFLSTVSAALAETGLPASLLEVELTEGVLMKESGDVAAKLATLRTMGVRVAIDDFGSGYSSLSRLHHLPIDTLKIDRSFITEASARDGKSPLRHRTAVVRSVVALARNLDLRLVAEGVETELQYRLLKRAGYDALQGYLFSKPLPATLVPAALDRLGVAQTIRARKVA